MVYITEGLLSASCCAGGMELPENVSKEAIAQFLDWDKECHETREGPRGSMGYREDRGGLHPAVAAQMQGIKGWQLNTKVHPKLAELAGNIEALWRQMFPLDFSATQMDPRWKLVDSVDPNQVCMPCAHSCALHIVSCTLLFKYISARMLAAMVAVSSGQACRPDATAV